MFETLVTWLTDAVFRLGYAGIAILMAVESSFIPFPSEVVLPPAGFLAAQGRMNSWLVLVAGIGGSLLGALVNYYLAAALGRPLLHRYSRFLFLSESKLDRAEAFFRRHGEVSTFVGRLVPVIRQLISLPAGLSRMRMGRFVGYTALGAGIWCAILTYVGWTVGKHAQVISSLDQLMVSPEVRALAGQWSVRLLAGAVIVILIYVGMYRRRHKKPTMSSES